MALKTSVCLHSQSTFLSNRNAELSGAEEGVNAKMLRCHYPDPDHMLTPGVNGVVACLRLNSGHISPERAAVVKLRADFSGFFSVFMHFNKNTQTGRVIVTLCSRSVSPPRLVPRAEPSAVNSPPPSHSLTLHRWRTSDGARLASFFSRSPKTYCNPETGLMWRPEPLCRIYLQYICLSSVNTVLKSPLHF